tara:strand:- start:1503 stop:1742 length:240 start_codon:yes stop_codon:yes gene_type:complete
MSNENVSYMEISSYYEKNRQADVVRSVGLNEKNYWGVRYWVDGNPLGIEWYPTKSAVYAEDAAENYILGIKEYPSNPAL